MIIGLVNDQVNKVLGVHMRSETCSSRDKVHQVKRVLLCRESKVGQCCAPAVSCAAGESLEAWFNFQLQWADMSRELGQLRADRINPQPCLTLVAHTVKRTKWFIQTTTAQIQGDVRYLDGSGMTHTHLNLLILIITNQYNVSMMSKTRVI